MELLHKELTDKILKAFYEVYNQLNYGFREKIYQKSLAYELRQLGLVAEEEKPISVYYKGLLMGEYRADFVVEGKIILELKAQSTIKDPHEAQLLHYLRAMPIEVGLVLNFGIKPEFVRKVYDNSRKKFNLPKSELSA